MIKTQTENPKGLHKKYYIQKIVIGVEKQDFDLEPLDEGFEGFVLRLDKGGDKKHVDACRKAILTYAEEIKDYLPELSKDLFEKYSN